MADPILEFGASVLEAELMRDVDCDWIRYFETMPNGSGGAISKDLASQTHCLAISAVWQEGGEIDMSYESCRLYQSEGLRARSPF